MSKRFTLIAALIIMGISAADAQVPAATQSNQEALVEQFGSGSRSARSAALQQASRIPPETVGPALRDALIEELERMSVLSHQARFRGFTLASDDNPENEAQLHVVVAALRDPVTIPALANALGMFTIIDYMVEWGEQAAPAVLDVVMDPASHYYPVNDGLRILRMMVENQAVLPLSADTLDRIRDAAGQRLTGPQYFTTVYYAIDLAAVMDDPTLRQRLEQLAMYPAEVAILGVDETRIAKTQQRAVDRLAGIPALPRVEDFPDR